MKFLTKYNDVRDVLSYDWKSPNQISEEIADKKRLGTLARIIQEPPYIQLYKMINEGLA